MMLDPDIQVLSTRNKGCYSQEIKDNTAILSSIHVQYYLYLDHRLHLLSRTSWVTWASMWRFSFLSVEPCIMNFILHEYWPVYISDILDAFWKLYLVSEIYLMRVLMCVWGGTLTFAWAAATVFNGNHTLYSGIISFILVQVIFKHQMHILCAATAFQASGNNQVEFLTLCSRLL